MSLRPGDDLLDACLLPSQRKGLEIFSLPSDGYGKRTRLAEVHLTVRGRKGVAVMQFKKQTHLAACFVMSPDDDVFVTSNKGRVLCCRLSEARLFKRESADVIALLCAKGEEVSLAISAHGKRGDMLSL